MKKVILNKKQFESYVKKLTKKILNESSHINNFQRFSININDMMKRKMFTKGEKKSFSPLISYKSIINHSFNN